MVFNGNVFQKQHLKTLGMEHTRQQVAATNHFVCTGEFLQKFLSPQQNFVIASSRTETVRLNLCNILRQQNSVAETKIFAEILQYTQRDLLLWLGALLVAQPVHKG